MKIFLEIAILFVYSFYCITISSLTATQELKTNKNCDENDFARSPIFHTFPRPPEVERLRRLANGPSPPAHIPSDEVVLEADGDPGTSSGSETTHIYCKPLQVPEFRNHKNSLPAEIQEKTNKNMTSSNKIPSSVVPIDISGQPFSRMASFRRSLIHGDFFTRKKKKEKRRNTVTEGDTKDLKSALQNIINEDHSILPNGTFQKEFISDGMFIPTVEHNIVKKITIEETNNNFPKDIIAIKTNRKNYCLEQDDKVQVLQNGNVKVEQKNNHNSDIEKSYTYKRKPKSHLPISTISAAMNVAVEMRQLKDIEDHSLSSYNSDHNSSDSDIKKSGDKEKEQDHSTINEDSGFSDNFKNRIKDNCKLLNPKTTKENEDTEEFSSASSENNTIQDDESSNATSIESDAFLMSSDESDEDSSELLVRKYGSSTSLSTMSDGSLNSLLSQTGTEMASSTGTLTSIGQERLPTPPPPPPPFEIETSKIKVISDATPMLTEINTKSASVSTKLSGKQEMSSKTNKKINSSMKSSKSNKVDHRKSSRDSGKNIFASLVNKKYRDREPCKNNNVLAKSAMTQPCFDMYGNNSPQKIPRSSIFESENMQPLSGIAPKSHLQSFLPSHNPKPAVGNDYNKNKELENKVKREVVLTEVSKTSVVNSSTLSQKNDTDIPLKYAHHVVVTPKSRQDGNNKYMCRKSLFVPELENEKTLKPHYHNQSKSRTVENIAYSSQNPQRPKTLQTGPKTAARVILDPEGRVIYSTNSLDRHLPYDYLNQHPTTTRNNNEKYTTIPSPINISESSHYNLPPGSRPENSYSQKKTNAYPSYCDINSRKVNNFSTFTNVDPRNKNSYLLSVMPLSPNQQHNNICETENRALVKESKVRCSTFSESSTHSKTIPPSYEEAISRLSPHNAIADPNVSGLPTVKVLLTEENINLHLENIERLNKMHLESIADSYKSLISPQTNASSPLDSNLNKLQKSTMSTEDLFAVIHDCKKRMNIKTDSDISLGSSSRSSSPSFLRANQTKGILAETGYLSPRKLSNFNDCRDRRSWADFRSSSTSSNERKSLASDRLGRTKPTSMHDFKMLLLQARSSTQVSGPKKSAVEMLKISQSPKSPNGEVLSSPSFYKQSFSAHSSPTSPTYVLNGHSTVPFKRHSNRVRGSLQSRYTMYPPIFEDCSEEAEIKSENT